MALNFDDIVNINKFAPIVKYEKSLIRTTSRRTVTAIRSQNISVCACVMRITMLHYKFVIS